MSRIGCLSPTCVGPFQAREIQFAAPQPGEDEALETENRVLANRKAAQSPRQRLQRAVRGGRLRRSRVDGAPEHLEELARYDPKFTASARQIAATRATVEIVAATVRDYAHPFDASPKRVGGESRIASHCSAARSGSMDQLWPT